MLEFDFNSTRHTEYKDYQDMYENHEESALVVRKIGGITDHPYLALGLAREVTLLYSDLAFGNPVNAYASEKEANDALDRIMEVNKLDQQLSEASISQSVKGGIVFKNFLDNGVSRITFVEPDYYFPTFSPFDKQKLLEESIAYKYTEGKDEFLYVETYKQDEVDGYYWCITSKYVYKNDKLGKLLSKTEVKTPLSISPLLYVPFIRSGSNFWGDSIYKGSVQLYDEINNRVTQVSNVLDKHSDPSMWALSSVFDESGNLNHKGGKVYEVADDGEGKKIGDIPLGYLTWDWSSEANFKFIDEIAMKILSIVSPLAPSLYGLDQASQASGRATILKSWRSQCKISRSYMYWRPALKEILYKAQLIDIAAGNGKYEAVMPNVELSMNVPLDFFEMAQSEQLKVTSKISSIKSAIARLNPHYTSKEVSDEYLDIINEQNEINTLTFMGGNQDVE
jgi:hypothetical protein